LKPSVSINKPKQELRISIGCQKSFGNKQKLDRSKFTKLKETIHLRGFGESLGL
jgi:hypothetical protein